MIDEASIVADTVEVSPPHPHLGRGSTLQLLALILVADVGLLLLRDDTVRLTNWWSSVGLGVGLLALSAPKRWVPLALAIFALTTVEVLMVGTSPMVALAVGSSHGAQALCGAAILTRLGRRRAHLSSLVDLGLLGLAALGVGAIAVVIETVARPYDAAISGQLALQVGAQHALSVLLFSALLISAARPVPRFAWVQSAVLVGVLAAVFAPISGAPIAFAAIPVLVAGAIAFEVRIAAAQLVVVTMAVTLATAYGRGPFVNTVVRDDLVDSLALGYVVCVALVTLPLAVIVTQRRDLMARVVSDEQLFRRSFTDSPLGMVLLREDGAGLVMTEANAAAERVFATSAAELEGKQFGDLVSALGLGVDPFSALLNREMDTWHGQAAVLERPGSQIDLAITAVAGTADASRTYSAQLLDRTYEHDSRRNLEMAQQLTSATLDTVACIVIVTDDHGTIVRTNAATEAVLGYQESDLVGAQLWDTPLAALSRSETEAMFRWPNRTNFPMARERLAYSAGGSPVRLMWNNNVVRDETGAPSYAVLTGVDVTAERSSTGLMAHLLQASIATALIGIDVSGMITVFSAGAAHMLGRTAEEMIGRPFVDILDPSQLLVRTRAVGEREAFLCLVGMIGQHDESTARDWTWRARNGHELIVSMTLSVTDDNVEDRVGFLCVGRDVTDQRAGQETIVAALDRERTAVERLRALDRAKDEFVSTVSHELRTPVTSILGYTELLLDGDVVEPHPQQAGMLETIARNSHRLIAICNDLLLLGAFDTRDELGHRETYDLREAIAVAEDFAKAACARRSLTITFDSPDEAVMVSGDRSQLDRVLVNLVSNAIKFTEDNGSITVQLVHDRDAGAVVRVGDTGLGIHPDEFDLIFQRFYRTDSATAMAIPGTGLGLSIVAGIVDAHGGTIAVESRPGEGTVFIVQLPVVE